VFACRLYTWKLRKRPASGALSRLRDGEQLPVRRRHPSRVREL